MKSCELCKCTARIYCESDQASLCWTCDAKVHSANFLVARHLRSLLCHSCKSPTPWSASGEKLGRTVSLCERCVQGCDKREGEEREESQGGNNDDFESESDYDTDEDGEDDDRLDGDGEEEEDSGNQVVPLSSTSSPPAASSSSIEEFYRGAFDVSSKRSNVADLSCEDELGCSSSPRTAAVSCIGGGEDAFVDSPYFRPFKVRKIEGAGVQHTLGGSRTAVIVEALERFHQQDITSSSSAGSKASAAVDLDLPEPESP